MQISYRHSPVIGDVACAFNREYKKDNARRVAMEEISVLGPDLIGNRRFFEPISGAKIHDLEKIRRRRWPRTDLQLILPHKSDKGYVLIIVVFIRSRLGKRHLGYSHALRTSYTPDNTCSEAIGSRGKSDANFVNDNHWKAPSIWASGIEWRDARDFDHRALKGPKTVST